MHYSEINDQGLGAMLTLTPNITSLTIGSIKAEMSFADRPCNWQKLLLGEQADYAYVQPSVLLLARLPLRRVMHLSIWRSNLSELQLPLGRIPHAQLHVILRQAATNLASCPAWQAGSKSQVSLQGDPGPAPPNMVGLNGQQAIQLLESLAPLGGPAVKQVEVSISSAVFQWGCPEVQALARSLGGQVTDLLLGQCSLQSDFWVALDECFPALTSLHLQQSATCYAPDVAIFCSNRPADRPFTLHLTADVYDAVDGEHLQASLAARGITHVAVARVAIA
jgi:hypothetical protein